MNFFLPRLRPGEKVTAWCTFRWLTRMSSDMHIIEIIEARKTLIALGGKCNAKELIKVSCKRWICYYFTKFCPLVQVLLPVSNKSLRRNKTGFSPLNPLGWLATNSPYNITPESLIQKLLIVKQILLVTTLGNVKRTV